MTGRTLFIINPAAGAGQSAGGWAESERQLCQDGSKPEVAFTTGPGAAIELARQAAREYGILVAVGGDGTVFEVVSGILAAEPPYPKLGILPLGTGNDIARALGIPSGLAAIQGWGSQGVCRVDAIKVRCSIEGKPTVRYGLGFAAVGITGELLRQTSPQIKRLFGQRLAYYLGLVLALWRYRCPAMKVICDGQAHQGRFLLACAGNAATFGGGMTISPGALIDDGRLNVNLIQAVGRWEVLRQLHLLRHARHVNHPKVRYSTAACMEIETEVPLEVAVDGSLVGHTPAQFEVQPKALEVLRPRPRFDSGSPAR